MGNFVNSPHYLGGNAGVVVGERLSLGQQRRKSPICDTAICSHLIPFVCFWFSGAGVGDTLQPTLPHIQFTPGKQITKHFFAVSAVSFYLLMKKSEHFPPGFPGLGSPRILANEKSGREFLSPASFGYLWSVTISA
jgi:hypothetical protein